MKKRITALVLLTAVLCLVLAGCKVKRFEYEPSVTSVFLTPEGAVRECLMDTFEESYMSVAGLEKYIKNQISEYQRNESTQKVALESADMKDGKVIVRMWYYTGKDYDGFNYSEGLFTNLRITPFLDSVEKLTPVIPVPKLLVSVSKRETANMDKLVKKAKNYTIAAGTAGEKDAVVYVEGKIEYVSPNITLIDQNMMKVPAGQDFVLLYR
ncbi:MAG: hypothetical protein IJL66_09710 [Lachnospiraceae bacterium]|nr:hypothetical protein [Lachnospiraceae bacterium]